MESDAVDKNARIRTLVVEDHEIVRMGLVMCLSQADGIEVVGEASNGHDGVAQAEALKPDLVLMDVAMPMMDGIEATRAIKASNAGVRVLVLTGSGVESVFAALAAGADGYLTKDTQGELLMAAIRAVSMGVAWLDPAIAKTVLQGGSEPRSTSGKRTKTTASGKAPFGLSPRELETLELIVEGLTNAEIGARLFVSAETVKTHIRHIMEKLVVSDRTQAAVKALRHGLVEDSGAAKVTQAG